NEYAWTSPEVMGFGAAGVILMILFVLQERRAAEPILPLTLFRDPVFRVCSGVSLLVGLALFGATVFLPMYFQVVTGASATKSGLLVIPMVAGLMLTSIGSGRLISRTGKYRKYPILGAGIATVGLALMSRLDVGTTRLESSVYMFVLGCGLGLMMQTLVLAVQNAVPHSELGAATSGVTFFRSMGGAFGVAIFGTILNNRLNYYVPRNVPAALLQQLGSPSGSALARSRMVIDSLPDLARIGTIQSFADALQVVFMVTIPLAAIAFGLTWLLKEVPLREDAHVGGFSEVEIERVEEPAAVGE
ncbi:MAG TPA: MFS transporter, partial [Tepidiformaceae bacterium]